MVFWRQKSLDEMTAEEWESLCDGCGLCCQIRLEDEDTGEIALSDVACRFLDLCTHRCKDYPNRQQNVVDCAKVTPDNVHDLTWLPHTCGYRLVAQGHDLPDWHPLVSGDAGLVHRKGPSMLGDLVSENEVNWQDYGSE
ncbi:MAG: YcgN family cysteine cluster protein [Geminicoccales bacterium]